MVLAVLGMVAEMELGVIRDRQRAGINAAKAKGVYRSRHPARSVLWRCKQSRGCYGPGAVYAPVARTLTRKQIGSRYILVGVRTLVDPNIPGDIETVHALQDGGKIEQPGGPGKFKIPKCDPVSQKKVRDALIVLATTLADTSHAFGLENEVDPVQRLISAAATWGGNGGSFGRGFRNRSGR